MSRKPPPPPREPIERALNGPLLAGLGEVTRLLGVPRDAWQTVPQLRDVIESAAVQLDAERLERELCLPEFKQALLLACRRLGVSRDNHVRRLATWRALSASLDRAECGSPLGAPDSKR